ncbi:tyrosine-type recombinase/integrase [Anaerotignum sp. MB30-C6]|uniref:tyrosine-type recombinase/integrase n=1 Tax=Anaerotignum sp. MB30-C6 TaxID=3070814 RepID=UPI0027DC4504|nr:tyrosine-type recombinase/integrase [Anaerotignum sp. MB30-C6]WMI80705.1 tyrosine-type recombinase/integrase [Anaerotignum sp. MB30-C6]
MSTYHESLKNKETLRLREIQKELPPFLIEFFRGIAQTTSTKTRLGYAYDLRIFFRYLYEEHKTLGGMEAKDLEVQHLNEISSDDIDCFMEYLSYYVRPDYENPENSTELHNDEKGKSRKLAAVRSMFKFFYKKKKVDANPATIVETPKIHDKQIVRLDVNEMADFLDAVESGEKLTDRQKTFHERTKKRDLAITTLLLGTGMRVSECVGINIKDIDFKNNAIKIVRKGGNEVFLYFGDEVQEALQDYLEERQQAITKEEGDDALFLSSQGKRITVRAVQKMVKKYALGVTIKNISPHKLRSTFGTNLYQETGDIYLVADTLGHADVNTTRKHYAEIEDQRRRKAASHVKLRKD